MENKGFYNTNATYEQAVNALGTTVSEWNIHDTETHKIKMVSKLLQTPEKVIICENWAEKIKQMDKNDSERLGNNLWDMKRIIFNYLYDTMGDFVKRGRPEGEDNLQTDIYEQLAKHYADIPNELKDMLRFGYAITESLRTIGFSSSIPVDGMNDGGLSMLGMAINWTLNHREFRTGECIDINNIYMDEDGAKKYIAENGLDKVETVPLTRDCFMTNISEMLEKPFYVTPNYFETIKLDYHESSKLPYTFCRKWFEENKDTEIFEDDCNIEVDGRKYVVCVNDEDLLTLHDDVEILDIIDLLAKDVHKYRQNLFTVIEAYKELESAVKKM